MLAFPKIFSVNESHHWLKKYYAHKRLYKVVCGNRSYKKDCPSVDIFDTKMDSDSPKKHLQNFLIRFKFDSMNLEKYAIRIWYKNREIF